MAAGVTGTAQIDQAVNRFLAESRFTLQERPGVVASSIESIILPENEGPSVNIPKYGTISTQPLTEGVDMTQAQQITDTMMTLTPAEYGCQVVLTDMMLMTIRDEFFGIAGRIQGESFDRQREQTLCDDFDNYSTVLGSAGTAMVVGHIGAAQSIIKGDPVADGTAGRGGEAGPDPITAVVTPAISYTLKKSLGGHVTGAVVLASGGTAAHPGAPNADMLAFSESYNVAGVMVKTSTNLNKDASDDVKCGIFSKQAQILVSLGGGPNEERERDASLRGWEVNLVGRWARGEYKDSWGIEGVFDSSKATS